MQSLIAHVEAIVGPPVRLELLEHQGRGRSTYRAHGPERTAIIETYDDGGGTVAGERIAALAGGPAEPRVPEVLVAMDRLVVLSDVHGRPLRAAALAGDKTACARAGAMVGVWHRSWRGRAPEALPRRTLGQELDVLRRLARDAPEELAAAATFGVKSVEEDPEWEPSTVVHGRLTEQTLLLNGEISLVGLGDVALGPPELDLGNLCGHLDFLGRHYDRNLDDAQRALVDGYLSSGAPLDLPLLLTCRSLALLRLGCLHRDLELASTHPGSAWPPPEGPLSLGRAAGGGRSPYA